MSGEYRFGLVGHNISYSRSPDIFKSIFRHNGATGEFRNYDLEPASFDEQFRKLIAEGLSGFSVTIPFKAKVLELLDDVDPVAKAIEAVNSISVVHDKLYGFNTDITGFAVPLAQHSDELKHGRAIVFGSGGGARAIIYSLYSNFEVREFVVVSRVTERIVQFQKLMQTLLPAISITASSYDNFNNRMVDDTDIIVNCTPAGGWNQQSNSPLPESFRWPAGRIYYDLNYNQGNKVLSEAQSAGLRCINGSSMLVGQALQSYYLWTGHRVGFEAVYKDVFPELTP
jgi:shikimate dehydrogenase